MSKKLVPNKPSSDIKGPPVNIKTICFYSFNRDNASSYLRFLGPIRQLGVDVIEGVDNGRINVERVSQADIVVLQRDFPRVLDAYEKIINLARKEGIPVVLDLDDLILELPEEHPDRRDLVYFESLMPLLRSLIEVDLVTVSTQLLSAYVQEFNNNVVVLPNFLDDSLWHLKPPSQKSIQDEPIIIGYMGNHTHKPDLALIEPVLVKLAELYPAKLQFHFWGMQPPVDILSIPQTHWHNQINSQYTEFASYFQTQSADIFIAPLVDNHFNNCKSHIKYLEYSALGVPGVYSRVDTYSHVINHGWNGFLASTYEEWIDCLIALIENEELRASIARNAQANIDSNWLLSRNAPLWLAGYQTAFEKKPENREHISTYQTLFESLAKQMAFWQDDRNRKLDTLNSKVAERDEDVRKLNTQLAELRQTEQTLRLQLKERDETISELNQAISELNQGIAEIKESNAWKITMVLRRIRLRLAPPNTWRDWMVKQLFRGVLSTYSKLRDRDIEQDLILIRSSDLFDEAWYLAHYPAAAQTNTDPIRHYLLIGGIEGCDPGPNFNSNWYLNTYPDVRNARINPLLHYLRYGIHESRQVLKSYLVQENESVVQNVVKEPPRIIERSSKSIMEKLTGGGIYRGNLKDRIVYIIVRPFQILKQEGLSILLRKIFHYWFEDNLNSNTIRLDPIIYDASIIIPVFNAVSFTRNCIDKIYATHNRSSFELIVIDNHSTDETPKYLKAESLKHSNLYIHRMPKNLGFAGAVNFGFLQAKGKHVIILNNDTLVTSGWLDRLINTFEQDELIGIVSPITNYVGEGPQIDPEAVKLQLNEIDNFAQKIVGRKFFYEPSRLVFFCVAIKREVIDLIGHLDTGYEKGNFEDDDYCMRALLAGFKLAIARDVFVYHFGTMTFKKNRISHNEFMEKNRKRFYQKAQNLSITLRPASLPTGQIKVSVIVRTMNRPDLLKNALTSLTNQSFKDFEVVIVNDGGDDISKLLAIYEKYFPVEYIHHAGSKGRTVALNTGINQSKGDWITFLDDDDIVYPWHLDTLVSGAKILTGASFFYTNYNKSLFTSHQEKYAIAIQGAEPWNFNKLDLLVRNFIPIHTWMVSRRCFEQVGKFLETQEMLEDFEFLVRLSKAYDFLHINRVTCEYRFYLDGVNSMVNQRPKTLDALKSIYSLNPVEAPGLVRERELELDGIQFQVRKIEEFSNMLSEDPKKNADIYLKIINLISGL